MKNPLHLVNNFITFDEKSEEITPQSCTVEEASSLIQNLRAAERSEEWATLFQEAASGNQDKIPICLGIIENLLRENKISVEGFKITEASKKIFENIYCIGALEVFRHDNSVDEIRVAPSGRVFLTQKGVNRKTDIILTYEEVNDYIKRLTPFKFKGPSISHTNPTLELVREDGARLTAITEPLIKNPSFALRKHNNIELTPESLISLKTFDERTWQIQSLLTRGRMNQLICGGVNTGKSTLLRLLIGEFADNLALRIIDLSNELRASELYPDRDIWELEVHPEIKVDFDMLFAKILRLTPDIIIVPEFRGIGEVNITIEACTRGHHGSMATSHFSAQATPQDIIRNIAILAIKEGLHLPIELVMEKVAQAFNIITQTQADSETGVRKIVAITEVYLENGKIVDNPLVKWEPHGEDYWGKGEWIILNKPSPHVYSSMRMFNITKEEIDLVFSN